MLNRDRRLDRAIGAEGERRPGVQQERHAYAVGSARPNAIGDVHIGR